MLNRRDMLQALGRLMVSFSTAFGMMLTLASATAANIRKRILPPDPDPNHLRNVNPRYLDTRNLKVMPLEALESVGDDEAPFDEATWRLVVDGAVTNPITLTYGDITSMPAVEREVLLICSGIFAFHGRWKGIPMAQIAKTAQTLGTATACIIHGHSRSGTRKERFKLDTLTQDEILLSYGVNGQKIGSRHGFPLRVVAPGHWGEQWVKYVTRIEFV